MSSIGARFLAAIALIRGGFLNLALAQTAMHRVREYCTVGLVLFLTSLGAYPVRATVVRFDTVMGTFDVRLFDEATPQTVSNLLSYIGTQAYDGTFIHRSARRFVVQGGGYFLDPDIFNTLELDTNPPVQNEPLVSNIRGTIAMAKMGGNPNSATSQWFFSTKHNTNNLDNQNGGFTAFGSVLDDGMEVVDAINALALIDGPGIFDSVPVLDLEKVIAQQNIFEEDAVIVNSVSVLPHLDGDYDFDGDVDGNDLAIWEADYGRLKFVGGDFNDDKEINSADLAIWTNNYGAVSGLVTHTNGDSNGDFFVDGKDFLAWQRGHGHTTDVAADGDGDAQITGKDFLLWQRNAGTSLTSAINSVPEPSSLMLVTLGVLILNRRRR